MERISVAVFDDHPVVLDGICNMLAQAGDMDLSGRGASAAAALDHAAGAPADVIVMDLMMAGDVCQAIARLARAAPKTRVLVFTASTETQDAVRVLEAGARGYVVKGSSGRDLAEAIRAIRRGEIFVSQAIAGRLVAAVQSATARRRAVEDLRLNVREEQILRLLLNGLTNKAIASRLNISEKTVKHYMSLVMQKLHVRNRVEAVLAAQKLRPGLASGRAGGWLQ